MIGNSKLEYKILIPDNNEYISCCSVNYHRTHFSKPYNIKNVNGEYCYTACFAFGIERLVYAFLSQKGLDIKLWDAETVEEMKSSKRQQKFVNPRHIALYICHELTEYTYTDLGNEFGGRDHSSIMHAVEKVEEKYFPAERAKHLNLVFENKRVDLDALSKLIHANGLIIMTTDVTRILGQKHLSISFSVRVPPSLDIFSLTDKIKQLGRLEEFSLTD